MGFHSQMVKLVNCGLRLSVDTKINLLREFWKLLCKLSHQSLPRFEKKYQAAPGRFVLYRWPLVLLIPKMDQQTLAKLSPLVSIAPSKK